MITREQVADLQPGDVVEYGGHPELKGAKVVGPLHRRNDDRVLYVADYVVRDADGEPGRYAREHLTLTVVSRAPRPLYVNHPRTEPMPGDVVRDADKGPIRWPIWLRQASRWAELNCDNSCTWRGPHELPTRLRLLVDGETGQVVQP